MNWFEILFGCICWGAAGFAAAMNYYDYKNKNTESELASYRESCYHWETEYYKLLKTHQKRDFKGRFVKLPK